MCKNYVKYLRGVKQGSDILNITAPFYELKDTLTIQTSNDFEQPQCVSFLVKPISDSYILFIGEFFYYAADNYEQYGYDVPFNMNISSTKLNLYSGPFTYPITATLYTRGSYGSIDDDGSTDYFKNYELKGLELRVGDLSDSTSSSSIYLKHNAVGTTYCHHDYGANYGYTFRLFGFIGGNLTGVDPPPVVL